MGHLHNKTRIYIFLGTTEDVVSNKTVFVPDVTVKVGKKKVKCDFGLVFVNTDVNLELSFMFCNKGAGGKTGNVDIATPEGYRFNGVVKPPTKIIRMTGGDLFGEVVASVPLDSNPVKYKGCGGYETGTEDGRV